MANKRKATRSRAPKKVTPPEDELRTYTWTFPTDSDGTFGAAVTTSDPTKHSGELDLIRDTIVKHRMHAQNIRERLEELVARLFGEGQASARDGNPELAGSMLARIRDEANELGDVLAGASDILDKLETL